MNVVGTVHSHPSPDNSPSSADIKFFSKFGGIHLIIAWPYKINTIKAYDNNGNLISI
jgi:proteasome lid subunit RPN8/RPN11